ncbi:hypothetical protein GVAV_001209 [Gurleya vavrai]
MIILRKILNNVRFKIFLKESLQDNIKYSLEKSNLIFEALIKQKLCIDYDFFSIVEAENIYQNTVELILDQLKFKNLKCGELKKLFESYFDKYVLKNNFEPLNAQNNCYKNKKTEANDNGFI